MNADRVKCNVTAGGTGALTLGAAADGFRTPAAAGIGDTGYVDYLAEWTGGWATGIATLSADGLTLTRVREYYSSANAAEVTAAPYANVPGSGATLAVVPHARAVPFSTQTSVNAGGVRSLESVGMAGGTVGAGSPNSLAIGMSAVDDNCPNGITIGEGGAFAPHALCIGNWPADQHGQRATKHGETALPEFAFQMSRDTANASPVDVFCDAAGTIRPVIPSDQVWLVRAFVVGLVSNAPGAIGNAYSRELRALGKPTGQVGATVSTAIASDAGFTGSATMSIDASGNVKVTVTGMAATTVKWSVHLTITPVAAAA